MENQLYVSQATFNQISCARCYKYMANLSFKNGSRLTYCRSGKLCRDCETPTECYVPYGNQSDVEVYDTFKKKLFAERWESCCRAARECCDEMLSEDADATSSPKVLVPAIVIFSVYKQLQVHRISLHKNFCVAMVLYDISVILVDSLFILDHVNEEKNIRDLCKVLYTLSRYFRLCQYAWMFCEGFYLHKLIASAFAEQKSLLIFYVVGWGCPAIFVTISAVLRAMRLGHPKAVRAVLVLFPLFGMHFLMTVYRSPANCGAWEVYQYISKASDGLQVLYLLKRSYGRYRLQRGFSSRRGQSMAMTRMSVSTHVSSVGDNSNPNNGSIKKYACSRNGDAILEEQVWN
ncbi:calcitonin receptor, putative [Ixodes scapularis]|uniref:Calcitonin receptor, putative n=1 Tax=Ixodes scapularis TaxID=6945 RepID=B7PBL1_IXOSC|nr:calcitonin receptor, putative [Ixodes scapularis]|eukprot:XP_002408426.1 calcitonin receptor, putative [Ixodes scapularis]